MATDLMEMLWSEADQVRDDVQSVGLKLEKLWRGPSSDDGIALDRLWVKIEEQGSHETFLHDDVVSLNILLVMADREDLSPKKFLKLQVLVGHVEDRLIGLSIELIKDGISDHLLKDALFAILRL